MEKKTICLCVSFVTFLLSTTAFADIPKVADSKSETTPINNPVNNKVIILDEKEIERRLLREANMDEKLADILGADMDTDRLKDVLAAIRKKWQDAEKKTPQADFNELIRMIGALEKPAPDQFPPGVMAQFFCYYVNDENLAKLHGKAGEEVGLDNVKCDSSIDGYAYAAYWLNAGNQCWRILDNMRYKKGFAFRSAVQEYFEFHQGKEMCIKKSPPRCQLGYCSATASYGIAFRPAVEFSFGAGTGLGFKDHNNVGFTLSGSLGARFFLLEDKIDFRLGLGIAALPIAGSTSEGMDGKSRSAFLISPGIGFFGGLFGVSGIFLFDPGGNDRSGKGIGLTIDVVAIKNIAGTQ
jgi:hypothetical protein